jgi:hypothetical protein
MKMRVHHAERLEDVRLGELSKCLAAHTFHDGSEQCVSAVVVLESRARNEFEPTRAREDIHNLLIDVLWDFGRESLQQECLTQPARVRQEMANGDTVAALAPIWNVLAYIVV